MTTTNLTILKTMNVLFWVVFIGLCIKTGALIVSFFVSLFVNPVAAQDLYMGLDLSGVQRYSQNYYIHLATLTIALSGLKAYIAYLVVKIFLKFDPAKPFNPNVTRLIGTISHVAVGAGIVALIGSSLSKWLAKHGAEGLLSWGANEILFFAGVIYIIAIVFQKGTELQIENDLTV
ncbi:DUF2975 domain-containing protein [Rudanella paleaurantiibacter]|uniref:DUF2975 domain-containing protein n=1 Tax=Rudanella paleaurantiibacter TaxID=2614655 RepID=A0A7J5TU11_9BACT|nr:DUF2975 domain-containing protein [Rudanella paleaurantiibacter]KAB7727366.1 DUF2975 domain-containing protein [Rudanella paleaurantiibacter]